MTKEKRKDLEVAITIQKHIFHHPFYNWCGDFEDSMKILIVGDTCYAGRFADFSLQTGQMSEKKLQIYWCISDPSTRENYLKHRPALREFVSVDKTQCAAGKEPYAYLDFKSTEEYLDSFSEECRYIFVATDDMLHNQETAELFKQAVREDCLASYLYGDRIEVSFNRKQDTLEHIETQEAGSRLSSEEELERMAFNTHRIWEGPGNLDYEKARERFMEPYNFKSSAAFVLSIPYKLRSVGIKETNPYDAAVRMNRIIEEAAGGADPEKAEILKKLSVLEHRRWVLEKVTEGAVRLTDKNGNACYRTCVDRASIQKRDSEGNLLMHPCIVRSTCSSSLNAGIYKDHSVWDRLSPADAELDELDLVSVQLHRTMFAAAKRLRSHREPFMALLDELRSICEREGGLVKRNYDRYFFCIENILDSSLPYAAQFETYEKMLRKNTDTFSKGHKLRAERLMDGIRRMLYPALESNQYRDYKRYNEELTAHLPFILTGKKDVHLCMPLGEASSVRGNNEDFFRSVASATALYAEKLTYLYSFEYTTNPAILESKLKAVRNYFDYRGKSCEIKIVVFVSKEVRVQRKKELENILVRAEKTGYIQQYQIMISENTDIMIKQVSDAVRNSGADFYDGTVSLTGSAIVNGFITAAISKLVPYFEFDSYNKKFVSCVNCDYLKYIRLSSFIQVEDMFALMNAQDKEFNYQDYADTYRTYWSIYCGDAIGVKDFSLCARSWTKVSNILRSGGGNCLRINGQDMGTPDKREARVVAKMLQALKEGGFLTFLNITPQNRVSVHIADKKVKRIFARAGEILEIYVYFEACRTGWFDDVQTGYRFRWEFDDVTNELDCVLTKGYRSLLVECKSTKDMDESFYLTLDSLADHFGIGCKKVLIAVTDTNGSSYGNYVSRGKQMDIITISQKTDLDRIGEKLKEIMMM